jgi:hypothetical protein
MRGIFRPKYLLKHCTIFLVFNLMGTAYGLEVIVNVWAVGFIEHGFHEYGTIDNELIGCPYI